MTAVKPPVNVKELLATVSKTTANIQAHRDAMAEVAATAKADHAKSAAIGGKP